MLCQLQRFLFVIVLSLSLKTVTKKGGDFYVAEWSFDETNVSERIQTNNFSKLLHTDLRLHWIYVFVSLIFSL